MGIGNAQYAPLKTSILLIDMPAALRQHSIPHNSQDRFMQHTSILSISNLLYVCAIPVLSCLATALTLASVSFVRALKAAKIIRDLSCAMISTVLFSFHWAELQECAASN